MPIDRQNAYMCATMLSTALGRRVLILRFSTGVKREEMACAIGLTPKKLEAIERLWEYPTDDTIAKICGFFHIPRMMLEV